MKKPLLLWVTIMLTSLSAFNQNKDNNIKNPALGIHFFFNDFKTASAIQTTSLSAVLRDKQFGKLKTMTPGIALNYIQGISSHLDFSTTLGASFLDYPVQGKNPFGNNFLLLEGDASVHAKMFPDNYWVVPYLSAGIGASKYKGYYGAFIPFGTGIQINLFDDADIMINSQYRLKVTDNTSSHFFYSIGVAGTLGSSKK